MYGQESSNTLSRLTRDSFHKKTNLKEIVLADSGSYISSIANVTNVKHANLDQKLQLLQRESISRGSLIKPPGTSGGRLPQQFGMDDLTGYLPLASQNDLPPKRYLPVIFCVHF